MGLRRRLKKDEFIKIGSIGSIKSLRSARLEITFPSEIPITHHDARGNEKRVGVDVPRAKGKDKRKR